MDRDPGREAVVRELLKCRSSLFAFILSLVRDFDFAEEAMREAALAISEQWADFKPGTDFGARAARTARDKVSRRAILLTPEAIAAVEKVAGEESQAGWPEALQRCLDRAGGQTRSMLAMRYRDGMSGREIARRTKTTPSAVHRALSRARRVLARCVEGRPAEREAGG